VEDLPPKKARDLNRSRLPITFRTGQATITTHKAPHAFLVEELQEKSSRRLQTAKVSNFNNFSFSIRRRLATMTSARAI